MCAGWAFLGLIGLLFTISRSMLKKQPLLYIYNTTNNNNIWKRNPQPFEGSIFLIKIRIQRMLRSLDFERKKVVPCVMYEHFASINGKTL
jgi:hypothetical protein